MAIGQTCWVYTDLRKDADGVGVLARNCARRTGPQLKSVCRYDLRSAANNVRTCCGPRPVRSPYNSRLGAIVTRDRRFVAVTRPAAVTPVAVITAIFVPAIRQSASAAGPAILPQPSRPVQAVPGA